MARLDPPGAGHDGRALDHVPKLADIAGPRVRREELGRGIGESVDAQRVLAAELSHEVRREKRNALGAAPERRKLQVEDRQPIVEILAEASRANGLPRRAIR